MSAAELQNTLVELRNVLSRRFRSLCFRFRRRAACARRNCGRCLWSSTSHRHGGCARGQTARWGRPPALLHDGCMTAA